MNQSVSVVIHTFNNENIIRDCLESVKDFDEIVICDMYSTDKTLDIANEYCAKIVMHENIGWADPARDFAIQSASNDWVLVVDSDERITPELVKYLKDFVKDPKNYTAVKMPRKNIYWGRHLEMEYPDAIIRFFRKDCMTWPPTVHSVPKILSGEIFSIPVEHKEYAIIHYSSNRIRDFINLINKYTDLEVVKMVENNKKVNLGYAFFQGVWLTFEKYLLKKGYKDGAQGFIMCAFRGFYKFLAHVKYWEYKKDK